MKMLLILAVTLTSHQSFAGMVPRINCVGSSYDKDLLKTQEIQEEKVLLEYRSGGAAFSNTFFGDLKDHTFIVVINEAFPISNLEAVPLSLGIYNAKTNKVHVEKNVLLAANGSVVKVEAKADSKRLLTLSCTRLMNPVF